ncbi:Bbp16 family capsid cement protein [Sphingomonas sp.]|uniref:Bbp16 family capsid cement protein n=1 Tax=Sphingomonas sp. TaxID=28214 RepID=UPI0025E554C2|nr:hypothetical protein [Sphingomonas sp.]MBV9528169.1 hypothetical protein [Sphingomonas sp.]
MAYVDKQLTLSDQQAVTATAVSTNALDTGGTTPIRDVGAGEEMFVVFSTQVAAAAAGAATVVFEVIQADDSALTTNVETLAASQPIGKALLVPGYHPFSIVVPRNTRRFIGTRYTVANGPLTAGTFTADIRKDRTATTNYASGYVNAA